MNIEQTSRLLGLSAHRVQHGEHAQLHLSEKAIHITPSIEEALVNSLVLPMIDRANRNPLSSTSLLIRMNNRLT